MKYWRTVEVRHFTVKCFVQSEISGSGVENVDDTVTDNIPDDNVAIFVEAVYLILTYIDI